MVRIKGEKAPDLLQDRADPMLEELCALRERVFVLEEKLGLSYDPSQKPMTLEYVHDKKEVSEEIKKRESENKDE